MKSIINRLQMLEKHFSVKPIPTIDQFKKAWAEADSLSRAVLTTLAESADFETMERPWRNYMLAVRGYLLQMGEISPSAESLRQIAAELEGERL